MPGPDGPDHPADPVLARREQIRHLAELGQRSGYVLYGLAVVVFVVGFVVGFPSALVSVIVVAMVLGSVLLLPAIIAGYAVKAADREDREQGRL